MEDHGGNGLVPGSSRNGLLAGGTDLKTVAHMVGPTDLGVHSRAVWDVQHMVDRAAQAPQSMIGGSRD
jgi:hypothetical protein